MCCVLMLMGIVFSKKNLPGGSVFRNLLVFQTPSVWFYVLSLLFLRVCLAAG